MLNDDNNNAKVCWYAARTGRGHELSVRRKLDELGVVNFIPSKEVYRERRGRKVKVEEALIPNLVFLRTTKTFACELANSGCINVHYMIDHSTRSLLVVPDRQMESFIKVVSDAPDPICPEDYQFVPGGKVRVTKGSFAGVEGEVVLLPNRTFVVVSLGGLVCAKVQIPRSCLEPAE